MKAKAFLAAALVALSAATASNALTVDNLKLTSIGSSDDAALAAFDGMAVWRVRNTNATDINIELQSLALGAKQFATAANGDTFYAFDFVDGNSNTTKLFWYDENDTRRSTVKAAGGAFDYTGVSDVPLPAGLLLALTGLGAFAIARRRRAA